PERRPPSPRLRRGYMENGCSCEFAGAEFVECRVRFFERKGFDFCFYRHARRNFEKFFTVAASQVGDGGDCALLPKIDIGKGRDVAHVNAAANHDAAFSERAKCCWNQRPNRRKNDRGIEFFRWDFVRTASPNRA